MPNLRLIEGGASRTNVQPRDIPYDYRITQEDWERRRRKNAMFILDAVAGMATVCDEKMLANLRDMYNACVPCLLEALRWLRSN